MLNSNIPPFYCYVPESYFTKGPSDRFYYCYAFGIQSVAGKILTFHVMTEHGMLRSRVPIHAIHLEPQLHNREYHFLQLWDCFGNDLSVIRYDYLCEKQCQVLMKDKSKAEGEYMFTVDWFNNPYSEEPRDYKCAHIIALSDGALCAMPNNRIIWSDMNFVTKPLPRNPKDYKVDTVLLSVESQGLKWVAEDTDSIHYDLLPRE